MPNPPLATERDQLHAAARTGQHVCIRGTVIDRGDGRSGRYHNVWLSLAVADTHIRVTAGETSPLGTTPIGATLKLVTRLTGIHDLIRDEYHGERARVLR